MTGLLAVDLDRLIAGLEGYAWPFLRITGLVLIAPVLGSALVARRVKMALVLLLTLALAPLVPPAPAIAPFSAVALLTAAQQLLIGIAIGFVAQIVFDALVVAGQLVATTMGLGYAMLIDPNHGANTAVVGQFFLIMGLLLFLALGGHLLVLGVLADSFRWLPPGPQGLDLPGVATLVAWGGRIFEAGVVIALPAVVGLLLVNLALGVVSRAAPQLNLFAVGFPVSMLLGFLMLLLSLPALPGSFERLLLDAFGTAAHVAGAR
jgi:flagellar biosynthesis protein FliR